MSYTKSKQNSKGMTIGIVVVCALVIAGLVGGAFALFGGRSDDALDLDFSIGGLSDVGTYVESDDTLYTKEAFECVEMKVTLDFDSNIKYQVFFYDTVDEFVSSTDVYSKGAEIVVPEGASSARIEITPIWASDVEEEDRVIKWYDISKYADQLNVELTLLEDLEQTTDSDATAAA